MKIVYKNVPANQITKDFLKGYERTNTTRQVYYLDQGQLKIKDDYFEEDWSPLKLEDISRYLKKATEEGGILIAAFDGNQVVGFTNIEHKIYHNKYVNMPYIHTHAQYRGQGIGEQMFQMITKEAKIFKVPKLYISTHPNIHAQRFYQRMGCVLAQEIIQELYDIEPLDIQLEYKL